MFLGHFAAALAAKRAAPRASLGWLVAACQLPDLVWPVFLLTGVERARIDPGNTAFTPLAFDYYPWSHSLLLVVIWGFALATLYGMRGGARRESFVLGALVVSHWLLDWITHRPDLPLAPGMGLRFGLGLWNSVVATVVVESALFVAAVWVYSRATSPSDRVGRWAWVGFVVLLGAIDVANIMGPPPPSITAVAVSALAMWLLVLWAAWLDRHRTTGRSGRSV